MDNIYKEYIATSTLKVIVEEGASDNDCCMIRIKHTPAITDVNSEILFPPCDLPEIIKALTNAALDATLKDNYSAGLADGIDTLKPTVLAELEKFIETNSGKKS